MWTRCDLEERLQELGLHLALELGGDPVEDVGDPLRELEALGVHEHQLLLDSDGERGACEVVFDARRGALLGRRRCRCYPGCGQLTSEPWRSRAPPSRSPCWQPSPPASARACAACCSSSAPATGTLMLLPDRSGHRARPARLLPEPRLEGPRVPVPPRRRSRLLGDRLPDRPRHEVLPGLRRAGAADPQGQRQDRHPVLRRRALDHAMPRSRTPCGSAPTPSATRSTWARRARTTTSSSCGRSARTATASGCRWSSGPIRVGRRWTRRAVRPPSTRSTTPRGWRWRWAPTS